MKITKENIVETLLDSVSRQELLQQIKREEGYFPETLNILEEIIPESKFNSDQFKKIEEGLLDKGEVENTVYSCFIFNDSFPEQRCEELFEKKCFLEELSYRESPIELLMKIFEYDNEYIEAGITVAKFHISSPYIGLEEFGLFLRKHLNNPDILKAIAYNIKVKDKKSDLFLDNIKDSEHFEEVHFICEEQLLVDTLKLTEDLVLLEESFDSKNPSFLKSIAQNPNASDEHLLELSGIKGIKFASEIRSLALNNLRNRE